MVSLLKLIARLSFLVLIFPSLALGQLQLPELVSDGMVLQRNADANIWGWTSEYDSVIVKFKGSTYKAKANKSGRWEVQLPKMKAGGPFTMTIHSGDTITIKDIMIGEVWVSSGQSNMELPMSRVRPLYEQEIANAENNRIRYFDVPQSYNFDAPQEHISAAGWQKASPETVTDFSAVAYFFTKQINQKYEVPVGVINASVGGSPAQAWISEEILEDNFSHYYKELQRFKDDSLIANIQQKEGQRRNEWYNTLNATDVGFKTEKTWYHPSVNTSDWSSIQIPGYWNSPDLKSMDGSVWIRKEIDLPEPIAKKSAKLLLGRIVDADSVFVNGTFVGTTGYQYPPRRYQVPHGILKKGKNTIAIRVIDVGGQGGFIPDKPYKLIVGDHEIDLRGEWKYHIGSTMDPIPSQTFIRWKPAGLYNAMIAPLQQYSIKGVIWYQGESNTSNPVEYRSLFATLIKDWRAKWNQQELPFLYVQLANFMEAKAQPSESNWAMLREAQRQTLQLPNTGMAVTIDIGEWNDIHPLNKKDVGRRLALAAQRVAYDDQQVVYSGPTYQSIEIENQKAILHFDNIADGLVVKGADRPKGFAIAGEDCEFVWAKAKISGNTVTVWNEAVKNPRVVRYGWADNPRRANLYNSEGLPASPFSTMGLKGCKK